VLRASAGPGELDVIVKTDRDISGARAAYVARSLGVLLSERCPGAVVAEPLGFSARDGASLWHRAQGAPLSELITRDPAGAEHHVALVGRALRVLHDHALRSGSLGVSEVLGTHDVTAEATATLRAGEHIRVLLPAVGRAYDALVATATRSSQGGTAQGLTFLHGDLKCDNLLVDGEQVRILDLDRCSRGDPALDLGKFLADLCWWSPAPKPGSTDLTRAFRDAYGETGDDRWRRAAVLAALFQLKFAARRYTVHDPLWATRVRDQVQAAATTLAAASGVR